MESATWPDIGRMDDWARGDSPAHRLDARAKAVATLAFIVVVMSFPRREVSALVPFLLYPVVLTSVSRIPIGEIFRKMLVASPFAVFVGMFNPLLDRQPAAVVGTIVISGGWLSFASILLRFVLTVWAALALVGCTGIYRLVAGLERLGLPRVFAVQLLFLYRYLFVIADEGARMKRGVDARAGGKKALTLRVYGSLIGHLLLRSMDRAERVHRAMLARGYEGRVATLDRSRFRADDGFFVFGCLTAFGVARAWNLSAAIGRLVLGAAA